MRMRLRWRSFLCTQDRQVFFLPSYIKLHFKKYWTNNPALPLLHGCSIKHCCFHWGAGITYPISLQNPNPSLLFKPWRKASGGAPTAVHRGSVAEKLPAPGKETGWSPDRRTGQVPFFRHWHAETCFDNSPPGANVYCYRATLNACSFLVYVGIGLRASPWWFLEHKQLI